MGRKKQDKIKISDVKEPQIMYNRVHFSTLETQNDIQLEHALNQNPQQRLQTMRELNEFAFGCSYTEPINLKNSRIVFSSYEYIP